MRTLRIGAQRASLRASLAAMLATSLVASVFAFGASSAAPAGIAAAEPDAVVATDATTVSTTTTAFPAPWYAVETYYLRLLNCTRTGGWVQKSGSCSGYGTGRYSKYVAPLRRSDAIASVSRSWAKYIAVRGWCTHGDPGARLASHGFKNWVWGENIGCWDMSSAYSSVLNAHRQMQAEKSTNGGHWKNMKNSRFKYVGIGVWQGNGHTRLVTDFYTP